ncbi:MAG: hypothetical protein ABR981_02340 [Candidatus Micrarchaeaceae archaeon]|jgi:hypothetical protein
MMTVRETTNTANLNLISFKKFMRSMPSSGNLNQPETLRKLKTYLRSHDNGELSTLAKHPQISARTKRIINEVMREKRISSKDTDC